MLYVIAAWAIALGIFEIGLAFECHSAGGVHCCSLGGLLSIAFGVVMFAEPCEGAVALLAADRSVRARDRQHAIALAIELRRVLGEFEHGLRPRSQAKPVTHG